MITDWDTLAATVLGPATSASVTVGGLTFTDSRFGDYIVTDLDGNIVREGRLTGFDLAEHKSLSDLARAYRYDWQRDEYTRVLCAWLRFVLANPDADHARVHWAWFERLSETTLRGGASGVGQMLFDLA